MQLRKQGGGHQLLSGLLVPLSALHTGKRTAVHVQLGELQGATAPLSTSTLRGGHRLSDGPESFLILRFPRSHTYHPPWAGTTSDHVRPCTPAPQTRTGKPQAPCLQETHLRSWQNTAGAQSLPRSLPQLMECIPAPRQYLFLWHPHLAPQHTGQE